MIFDRLNRYQKCLKAEKQMHQKSIAELKRLNRFIGSCRDPLVRCIMLNRFVKGLSWVAVAQKIGGNISADNCRMLTARYLQAVKRIEKNS